MTHWLHKEDLLKVCNCFETNKDIWTQGDIAELTGLTQPAISEALAVLVKQGILCWIRNDGVSQVKFYNKVSNKIPVLMRRKKVPILYEEKWIVI